MSIRILLADDHGIVREGLKALIEKEQGMEVVGEAAEGRSAVRLAAKLKPAVVLIDVSMPDLNGIDAARQILAADPGIKVLALSMHRDKRYVGEMLKAGAAGYLLKDMAFEEVTRAIRAVVEGQIYLSRGIVGVVVEDYVHCLASAPAEDTGLTPREREILQLIAEGRSTKEVAGALHVSVKTIETHRRQIMEKLDVHSVAELTKYAIRHGLTSLE
jgi:two-component system, NarL family, response regulator NreC